jgi:nucleotide-binding universal stress UspA family protein
MTTIKRILVPVDFSEQSRAAVKTAIVFAQAFEATVDVAHLWTEAAGRSPGVESTLREFSASEAGEQMRQYLESLEAEGVEVRGRLQLVKDEPYKAIVELADNEKFDMIVLGTHGRTGVSHLLHPSVAERVVRNAPCPVLTIRIPDSGRKRRVTVPIPVADS